MFCFPSITCFSPLRSLTERIKENVWSRANIKLHTCQSGHSESADPSLVFLFWHVNMPPGDLLWCSSQEAPYAFPTVTLCSLIRTSCMRQVKHLTGNINRWLARCVVMDLHHTEINSNQKPVREGQITLLLYFDNEVNDFINVYGGVYVAKSWQCTSILSIPSSESNWVIDLYDGTTAVCPCPYSMLWTFQPQHNL